MEIRQTSSGVICLYDGPRSLELKYDDARWICEDYYDEEFNDELAKKYYFNK